MSSLEYLRKVTLGKIVIDPEIKLVPYDPEWPVYFEEERQRIVKALGKTALRVEHVGSTSIAGLSAKPIIDILLIVPDTTNEVAYVPQLEAAGYRLRIREPEWHQHRMFYGSAHRLHCHVFSQGDSEAQQMLLFRDWLRIDEADRRKYQETKEALAKKSWATRQDYADAKGPVITEIKAHAAAYFAQTDR